MLNVGFFYQLYGSYGVEKYTEMFLQRWFVWFFPLELGTQPPQKRSYKKWIGEEGYFPINRSYLPPNVEKMRKHMILLLGRYLGWEVEV